MARQERNVAESVLSPDVGQGRPRRSARLIASVLAALAVGMLGACTLPANNAEPADRITIGMFGLLVFAYGGVGSLMVIPLLGITVAIVAVLAFSLDQRVRQAWWISLGVLAYLTLPLGVYVEVGENEPLGVGWFLPTIAFVVAAAIPWVAVAWERRAEDWTEDWPPEQRHGEDPASPRA